MRTSKFTPEQMVHILRQGDSGLPVVELCRPHGISAQTFYRDEALGLRRKEPKRRRAAMVRQPQTAVTRPNEWWTMDLMSDARGAHVDADRGDARAAGHDQVRQRDRVHVPGVRSLGVGEQSATRLQPAGQADRQRDDRVVQRQRSA
ncbi:MAG TPA: transposase [Candidatus Limnocylindria bacterium]|nr:transposase [Candidatus Limnocylindria bacterium]